MPVFRIKPEDSLRKIREFIRLKESNDLFFKGSLEREVKFDIEFSDNTEIKLLLSYEDEDDFKLTSSTQIVKMIKGVSSTLHIFLLLIAGLSLVVGGIVIMNIMLISVSERKKEIGLRKAVGARSKDILLQFVLESIAITLSGGILGFIVGILGVKIMEFVTSTPAVVSWEALALAFGFSIFVGIIFGVQPARKAARLDPVESLR